MSETQNTEKKAWIKLCDKDWNDILDLHVTKKQFIFLDTICKTDEVRMQFISTPEEIQEWWGKKNG